MDVIKQCLLVDQLSTGSWPIATTSAVYVVTRKHAWLFYELCA